jgi:hypothetical protein
MASSRLPSVERARILPVMQRDQAGFPYDSLVRFTRALNPVLIVIAFRRQQLRDLVDAIRAAAAKGSGRKTYR